MRTLKIIAGVGWLTSAMIGAKTVQVLATTLQMPIVVVLKTIGKYSIWIRYNMKKVPERPKFITKRQPGTTKS